MEFIRGIVGLINQIFGFNGAGADVKEQGMFTLPPVKVPIALEGVVEGIFVRDPAKPRKERKTFGRVPVSGSIAVDANGLQQSMECHRDPDEWKIEENPGMTIQAALDRAVLVQTYDNLGSLAAQFPDVESLQREMKSMAGAFGENLTLSGLSSDNVCIGDIFEVTGSTLLLQVSTPRRPCSSVDTAHGKIYKGDGGVRQYCAGNGKAGWFCRVLREGKIQSGSQLRLIRRDHPRWTVNAVSNIVYTGKTSYPYDNFWSTHVPSGYRVEMLQQVVNVASLGDFEWKALAHQLLKVYKESKKQN